MFDTKTFINWKRCGRGVGEEARQVKQNKNGVIEENLIVKGDNLPVLKILKKRFLGKVNLIYIDPPYNTGKDGFNYNDKFESPRWLAFMSERLRVAKELLAEEGSIFVSIDDHEQAHLRVLMDEIFGRENFIVTFTWQRKKGGQGVVTKNMVVSNHEYIIVFAKQKNKFQFKGLERDHLEFSNPDNDPRGKWKRQYLQRFGQGFPRRTIINPENNMRFTFETPYSKEKLNKWIKEKIIMFPTDNKKYPARKEFLNDYRNKKQLVSYLGLFPSKSGTEELYKMFDGEKVFRNPKPMKLMKFIIEQATSKNDVVLDFFAGSGTTGHAVLKTNKEDKGDRKFILVEQTDFINTVLCPRIQRAMEEEKINASFVYFELANSLAPSIASNTAAPSNAPSSALSNQG